MVSTQARYILLIFLTGIVLASCSKDSEVMQGSGMPGSSGMNDNPYVLLVSFDGFRHDYVEKFDAPNFKAFIETGTAAESMRPVFPSKTFPNHYSTITGMYPINSGIIDNIFYDPESGLTYSIGDNRTILDPYFYNGTPIWRLVQQNGLKSASYYWLGSEVEIAGGKPDYYEVFNSRTPNLTRIEGVIDWFNLPATDRPNFVTLYFSLVDSQGHATGPESGAIEDAVLEADQLLGVLMDKLSSLPFEVNVIITSDHGMYQMENKPETFIYRDDLFNGTDMTNVRVVSNRSHLNLFVSSADQESSIYDAVQAREENFKIYKKDEIPEEWHYRNSDRVGDLFLQAEPGHFFTTRGSQATNPETRQVWGIHGFDPFTTPEMHGIFYAQGPKIKEGFKISTFSNINVYPLICELFGIRPPEDIDGKLEVLAPILKD